MRDSFVSKIEADRNNTDTQILQQMKSRKVVSTLVMVLVILTGCDDAVAFDDTSRHYVVVKNQQNVRLCSNATVPNKTIKMVRSPILCSGECSSEKQCVGFNFRKK